MINNLKNMLKSVIALFGVISITMLTVFALSAHYGFKSTIEPNITFGVWLILVMTFMVFTIAGIFVICEYAVSNNIRIPENIRNKVRANVRAYRNYETGEISYILVGNKNDEFSCWSEWEDVIIMPDLTNQEIDYLLEN